MYFIRGVLSCRLISRLTAAGLNKATTSRLLYKSERFYSSHRPLTLSSCRPICVSRVTAVAAERHNGISSTCRSTYGFVQNRFIHNREHWSVYNMACPGNKMRWDLGPDDLAKEADLLLAKSKATYDAVGALKREEVTVENVVKKLTDDFTDYSTQRNLLDFVQHVSPDKSLRDASVAVDKKLSEFDVEMSMRQDVFDNLLVAEEKFFSSLDNEGQRYLKKLIKLGRRNGLHLPKDVQDKVKEIKKRMSDLSIDFNTNLNEENTVLQFTEDQLAGVPDDFLNSLEKTEDGSKLKVSLKYPHYFPCMKFCHVPDTRRQLEMAFNSRCLEKNTAILEELIELRAKKAALLGYDSHAAFVLDMRMAKTPQRVDTFLTELSTKLAPLQQEEMKLFLDYKKEECEKYGYEFDNKIHMYDYRYYMTRVEEKKYAVDKNILKEYFPLEVVTKGLFDIYQDLLSLKYEEIPNAQVWCSDVKLYSVKDKKTDDLIGYFYLDLFPREGKYGHAACFGLQPGCLQDDGKRQVAVAAMVANFTKPTADATSLLPHDEVETFFHEFGHVMHQICAQANYALFSGTAVERDFVEAPSQMLENWVWEKESLRRMSSHYKDGTPIPDELLEPLIASKTANAGIFNQRQILLSTFDQTIHTQNKLTFNYDFYSRPTQHLLFCELSEKILGIKSSPGTNMASSFGHLAGGYDAQYYGYMWSEVFSADMFYSRFKKEGLMNPKVGLDYRRYILGPGGSVDADEMLKNFLGREPQQDAFLISKGLKTKMQEQSKV
ncbi:hypothetical protein LSH36_245g03012 [Paralvinella palmiformis]|uniref:Peptidase M3A/M3B catalytic domain-containing protein n=1 Tax=Paralvinella palmiformis TaxID=53620 RepID=A0AAD9JLF5_9ANNE|nr:hypothetical protein LSH36_245g03012 [Paralvinella palmiformis]